MPLIGNHNYDKTELSDATARDRLIDSRIHLVRAMKELDRDGARRAQALTASAIVAVDDALREFGR